MTTELRRDVLLPFIVLMAMLVLTSGGAVALQARMAPAIDRIIANNLYSLHAAEEMLAAIGEGQHDEESRARFAAALARAESNVTEAEERQALDVVRENGAYALAGDLDAKRRTIAALIELGTINRAAVVREDETAMRLGFAGAWATAFLGALSFAWALIAVRKARRRLIDPLHEVGSVLDAAHAGDTYRRCRHFPAAAEVVKIMAGVDELLDARALQGMARQPSLRAVVDRPVLLHLLELRPAPTWIVTRDGLVDAANRTGLERLSREDAEVLRQRLAAAAAGEPAPGIRVEPIAGIERFLCEAVE